MTNKPNSTLLANLQILQRQNTLNKLYKNKIQNHKYRKTIQTDTPNRNNQKKIHKKSLELPQIETSNHQVSDKVLLRQAIKFHNEVIRKRRLYPLTVKLKRQSSIQNVKNNSNRDEIRALEKQISQKILKKTSKQDPNEPHLLKQTSIIFQNENTNDPFSTNTFRDIINPQDSLYCLTKRSSPKMVKGTYYEPKYKSLKKSKSKNLYGDYNITTYIKLQQDEQLPISFQMPLFQASEKLQILKRHSERIRSYLTNMKQQNLSLNMPGQDRNSLELKGNVWKNNNNLNSIRKKQTIRYKNTIDHPQQCSPWNSDEHDHRRFEQLKLKELLNNDM